MADQAFENLNRMEDLNPEIMPTIQGTNLCLDTENQCYFGQIAKKFLDSDKEKNRVFTNACSERKGAKIRCCSPDLVNVPYQPGPLEIPYMVQLRGASQYVPCPTKVRDTCLKIPRRDRPLCIQNACNDAGYKVATNLYEICKAYDPKGIPDVPDCPTKGCWGNRFRMPEEADQSAQQSTEVVLGGKTFNPQTATVEQLTEMIEELEQLRQNLQQGNTDQEKSPDQAKENFTQQQQLQQTINQLISVKKHQLQQLTHPTPPTRTNFNHQTQQSLTVVAITIAIALIVLAYVRTKSIPLAITTCLFLAIATQIIFAQKSPPT